MAPPELNVYQLLLHHPLKSNPLEIIFQRVIILPPLWKSPSNVFYIHALDRDYILYLLFQVFVKFVFLCKSHCSPLDLWHWSADLSYPRTYVQYQCRHTTVCMFSRQSILLIKKSNVTENCSICDCLLSKNAPGVHIYYSSAAFLWLAFHAVLDGKGKAFLEYTAISSHRGRLCNKKNLHHSLRRIDGTHWGGQ